MLFCEEKYVGSHLLCESHQPQYGSLASRHSEHRLCVEQLCTRTRYTCVNQFTESSFSPVVFTGRYTTSTCIPRLRLFLRDTCNTFYSSIAVQQQIFDNWLFTLITTITRRVYWRSTSVNSRRAKRLVTPLFWDGFLRSLRYFSS